MVKPVRFGLGEIITFAFISLFHFKESCKHSFHVLYSANMVFCSVVKRLVVSLIRIGVFSV